MKYRFVKLFVASLGLIGLGSGMANAVIASEDVHAPYIYSVGELPFESIGGASGGAQAAILFGNPDKEGPYVTRLKLPSGAVVPPHYHNDALKIATLIEGSIGVAYGEAFDEDALKWLTPGAIWTEPKGQAHYGKVGKDGAVLELHGIGPVSIISLD